MNKIKYYRFDNSDTIMMRNGASVSYLDSNGQWNCDRSLIGKFIGGDTDFEEISETEAESIVLERKNINQDLKKIKI